MNKVFGKVVSILALALMVSCQSDSIYSGFKRMDNGAYMKFYERSNEKVTPRLKDGVTFEMAQYFNDTLLFTTVGDEPVDIVLEPAAFVGDVTDALMNMHIGDSARMVVIADSVFSAVMEMETPEEYAGKAIYYDLKLLSITPYEEIEASYMQYLDSLRMAEQTVLEPFRNAENEITESGIIVLGKTGNGKTANMGDYVNFDFLLCSLEGDTIMNSFDVESLDFQYGSEDFLSKGFTEAVGMVKEGGRLNCVLPSSLAFDSVGYQQIILPYMPLRLELQMNSIMTKEAHDKFVAEEKAKHQAEHEKVMEKQRQLIAKYVKDNNITEEPSETGLYVIWKENGTGDMAQWGDKVAIHYTIYNLNGEEVESSYKYDMPMQFTIGNGEMILSIEEALMQMNLGSKVRLIVPSDLGFGEIEIDPQLLPADSPLIIDLELVSIE